MSDVIVPVPDPTAANVEPDRLFFISMLTRDVELIPAILDLWDNSIDAAMRFFPEGKPKANALTGFKVDIVLATDSFSISDNCGGITLDDARNKAFRLGRGENDLGVEGAVGSFGVGMKRSLFKIGKKFRLDSRSVAGSFDMDVDISTWKDEKGDWKFPFGVWDDDYSGTAPYETRTKIHVGDLYEPIAAQFAEPNFTSRLETELRIRRPEAYEFGIVTTLNGKPLSALPLVLNLGSSLAPLTRRVEAFPGVFVTLRAGMVASPMPSNPEDDGDATKFVGRDDAGWYVLANGRVLLAAEKTRLSGWGDDVGRYHPQYRNFRGFIDIRATDGRELPWNTTKTGVDEDSPLWRVVYGMMRIALAEVQTLLNRLKDERANELTTGEVGAVTSALTETKLVPVDQIPADKDTPLKYPKTMSVPKPAAQSISFKVEKARFDLVSDVLGVTSPPEVGRQVFAYYERMEIE